MYDLIWPSTHTLCRYKCDCRTCYMPSWLGSACFQICAPRNGFVSIWVEHSSFQPQLIPTNESSAATAMTGQSLLALLQHHDACINDWCATEGCRKHTCENHPISIRLWWHHHHLTKPVFIQLVEQCDDFILTVIRELVLCPRHNMCLRFWSSVFTLLTISNHRTEQTIAKISKYNYFAWQNVRSRIPTL